MTDKLTRVVLAIYSSPEEAERSYKAVRSADSGKEALLAAGGGRPASESRLNRYLELLLDGESAVVVAAPPSEVQALIKKLRSSGDSSIFLLPEQFAEAGPPRSPTSAMSIAEMARKCSERSNRAPLLKDQILADLRNNEKRLEIVRKNLVEAARLDHTLTASAEWLLDNAYLVRTNIAEIRRAIPKDHIRVHSQQFGFLFVSELAAELVQYSDHALDAVNISEALTEYQRVTTLSIAELWSFPLLLRLSLIDSLACLARGVDQAQQLREAGYFWANRLAVSSRGDEQVLEHTLQLLESEPFSLEPYFATCLIEQLQDEDRALAPTQQWIEARLGIPLGDVVRNEHNREAAERVSIANAFGSLRALGRLDFTKIFEATSLVEAE